MAKPCATAAIGRRARFERDPAGTVMAMEQLYAAGFSARFLRGA